MEGRGEEEEEQEARMARSGARNDTRSCCFSSAQTFPLIIDPSLTIYQRIGAKLGVSRAVLGHFVSSFSLVNIKYVHMYNVKPRHHLCTGTAILTTPSIHAISLLFLSSFRTKSHGRQSHLPFFGRCHLLLPGQNQKFVRGVCW
jgi:hypothetical protein